jgi:hypothetical protein
MRLGLAPTTTAVHTSAVDNRVAFVLLGDLVRDLGTSRQRCIAMRLGLAPTTTAVNTSAVENRIASPTTTAVHTSAVENRHRVAFVLLGLQYGHHAEGIPLLGAARTSRPPAAAWSLTAQ